MKILTILLLVFFYTSSFSQNNTAGKKKSTSDKNVGATAKPYIEMITEEGLSTSLHFITSDYFKGRAGGSAEERVMATYLASTYKLLNIPAIKTGAADPIENYLQPFTFKYQSEKTSQNVLAILEGSDPVLKHEAIVIVAHYDHLGMDTILSGDQIFNGAADDGSGTAALLLIARSFAAAKNSGVGPKRTIIFFHAGAEERGLRGSAYYVNQVPLWPLEKTAAVINMDGVGGIDVANLGGNSNYVYVLHPDSTARHLYEKTIQLNKNIGINLELLYPKNAAQFNSDHNSFQYLLVPSIYFSTGLTEHYHKVSDEAATIDYVHMAKIVRLVFALAWESANNPGMKSPFSRSNYETKGYYCLPCGCPKDNFHFDKPGVCDACNMTLAPVWKRR